MKLLLNLMKNSKKIFPLARTLDKYYIPTQYPDALPDEAVPSEVYEAEDAERALSQIEKLININKD